jgi:prevent-host-death family protein
MTMLMVNIFEAKTQLSDLIDKATSGERVVICKRNQPIAELRPVAGVRRDPRPVGLAKGLVEVPPSFFDPLPADLLDAFGSGSVYPPHEARTPRVAERGPRASGAAARRTRARSRRK